MALIVQSLKENCCVFLLNLPPNVFRNKRQYQFSRIIDYDLTANIVNQHHQHKSNANTKAIKNKKRDHTFMTGWKGLIKTFKTLSSVWNKTPQENQEQKKYVNHITIS